MLGHCEVCGVSGDYRRDLRMVKGRWACQDTAACKARVQQKEAAQPPKPERVEPMPPRRGDP